MSQDDLSSTMRETFGRIDFPQASRELPKYRCHKEVYALKIKAIRKVSTEICREPVTDGTVFWIVPEDSQYAEFEVPLDFITKHQPQPGGYYVVYKDGYRSFSPAEAFEDGYTRI
jgi:hypothetical protein